MPPSSKARPYKDFLTPALHRRFVAALLVCLALCYLEAIFIGGKTTIFWLWFPLGKTGLKTMLLFLPVLCIFLLRVTQLHFGYRTSYSGWHTFKTYAFRFQTAQTVATYCFSAFLFSEIYIWSMPTDADLTRIKYIPRTNRTVLNEKPIYFSTFFFFLAILQSAIHLFYDYDRIDNPTQKFKSNTSSTKETTPVFGKLKSRLPALIRISAKRAALFATLLPVVYVVDFRVHPYSVRSVAWSVNRSWARIFWSLSRSNSLPTHWPFHWSILMRTATSGFLLTLLWETGNEAFSIYTVQEPLKNGKLLTSESRDPNASLIHGLKSKRVQTKVFAFWELAHISHHFKERRKSIFDEIDKIGGSCWSQIRDACLEEMHGILSRINDFESPSEPSHDPEKISSLPRLTEPLRDGFNSSGDLFTNAPPPLTPARGVARAVGNFAKSRGQSSPSGLSPKAKLLLQAAENTILTDKQKMAIEQSGLSGITKEWIIRFLKTDAGRLFRQEYRRKLEVVVLGTPYGDVGVILDAIESLSRLTTFSLTEDRFGNVQRDVKMIIQTFTDIITKLTHFKKTAGVSWTDVLAVEDSPEVDQVLVTLKRGLRRILDAFEIYSDDLRINPRDLRMAKEAIE